MHHKSVPHINYCQTGAPAGFGKHVYVIIHILFD